MPPLQLILFRAIALLLSLTLSRCTLGSTAFSQQPATMQQSSWSQRMADATMARWPQGRFAAPGETWKWNYELAMLLNGIDAVWYSTADGSYFRYTKQSVDALLAPDGSIPSYDAASSTLDNIALGRNLLLLYRVTRDARYYKAAALLRKQLASQPRTDSGGFWRKKIYPGQMWLDGLYMAEPFYAEYATVFQEPDDFADIAKQFTLAEAHTRDPKTGLLYHAWDESKKQPWADPANRCLAYFLGPHDGLVHDGSSRYAALLSCKRSQARPGPRCPACHSQPRRRGRHPRAGPADRPLVSGSRPAPAQKATTSSPRPPACSPTRFKKACASAICRRSTPPMQTTRGRESSLISCNSARMAP